MSSVQRQGIVLRQGHPSSIAHILNGTRDNPGPRALAAIMGGLAEWDNWNKAIQCDE